MVTAQLQGTLLILYQKKKKSFSLLFGFPDGCIHFLRDYLLGQFCCHLWMTFSLTCNSLEAAKSQLLQVLLVKTPPELCMSFSQLHHYFVSLLEVQAFLNTNQDIQTPNDALCSC